MENESKRREIEKLGIDKGFDLGAEGAEERDFKKAGRIFSGLKL